VTSWNTALRTRTRNRYEDDAHTPAPASLAFNPSTPHLGMPSPAPPTPGVGAYNHESPYTPTPRISTPCSFGNQFTPAMPCASARLPTLPE
jgi:hypothetical protein